MAYVLTFFAGVLLTLLVRESGARRLLVLVTLIGALFGGAVLYAGTPAAPASPSSPSSPAVPAPPIGDL